jgi:hypothetical protein
MPLLEVETDPATGLLAWFRTRVRLRRVEA